MLLVDDILLLPLRGVLWCVKEVKQAAEEALAAEGESLRTQLTELYMRLETGRITEAEFEAEETELLDRLDRLESGGGRMLAE